MTFTSGYALVVGSLCSSGRVLFDFWLYLCVRERGGQKMREENLFTSFLFVNSAPERSA